MAFLAKQGFKSLIASLGGSLLPSQQPDSNVQEGGLDGIQPFNDILPPLVETADYELVTSLEQLDNWLADARRQGFVAIDTETSSLNAAAAKLIGVALATAPGKACYIPLRHYRLGTETEPQKGLDFGSEPAAEPEQDSQLVQIDIDSALARLRGLCESVSAENWA